MNVFVLDTDPYKAAEYHCDVHINKMLLETAQLLSSVIHAVDPGGIRSEYDDSVGRLRPWWMGANIYGPAMDKGCADVWFLWAKASRGNMEWLLSLADGLNTQMELRWRHPGYAPHSVCLHIRRNLGSLWLKDWPTSMTPFPLRLPPKIVNLELDPVTSYRLHYASDKRNIAEWKKVGKNPPWWEASCSSAEALSLTRSKGTPP